MAWVLVVDDDPDIRLLLELALGLDGHEVVTAESGGAALERLRDPDLRERRPTVVLDVQMPDLDGWHVLRAIRADDGLHDLPVVLCTVRAGAADVARGWAAGCDAYQPKPFDIAAVSAQVRALDALDPADLRRRRAVRLAASAG